MSNEYIQLPVIAGGGQGLHERRKAGNPHVRGGRQAPRVQQGHRACRGNCQVHVYCRLELEMDSILLFTCVFPR